VPTTASYPYDLQFAGESVWFTQRDGNKIGRLDPATSAFTEYDIPTSDSEPTGIAVRTGTPIVVWFTERAANQLGQLVITDTTTAEFLEYPLPTAYPNAYPQDVEIFNTDSIWFTAPGVGRIGWFKPSLVGTIFNPYEMIFSGGEPWSISKGSGNTEVWFTDRSGNRVGTYFPQTISIFLWYSVPTNSSNPYDVVAQQGRVWMTEEVGRHVGEVAEESNTIHEYGVDATLHGLDVDGNQHIWFAEYSANKIGEWKPPYFYMVMLPLVSRVYP
jgi:streptogramin lyase